MIFDGKVPKIIIDTLDTFKNNFTLLFDNLHAGMALTSAVTTQLIPRLDKAPRIIPQGNARYWNSDE